MVVTTTPVKSTRLTTLNVRQSISVEINAEGAIKSMHPHTPSAQLTLISLLERRLTILTMSGIFHKGSMTAEDMPSQWIHSCVLLSMDISA